MQTEAKQLDNAFEDDCIIVSENDLLFLSVLKSENIVNGWLESVSLDSKNAFQR